MCVCVRACVCVCARACACDVRAGMRAGVCVCFLRNKGSLCSDFVDTMVIVCMYYGDTGSGIWLLN